MIYTFYSYKGGVGRSMALANIAESFHEKGLRVIMIDWDLEAPGLETFFCSPDSEKKPHSEKQLAEFRAHSGLIDMIVDYKNAYPRFAKQQLKALAAAATPAATESIESKQALIDKEQQAREVAELTRKALKEANVPDFLLHDVGDSVQDSPPPTFEAFLDGIYRKTTASISPHDVGGALAESPFLPSLQCIHLPDDKRENGVFLLSAGARSEERFGNYATAVQGLNWSEFYAAYDGPRYFSWFRDQLQAIADVVLIDSRTGVTEMGGVCTRHIPDAVIGFCAPNFQNVDGVVRVVSGLNNTDLKQVRNDRAVQALVIPTRIDVSE
jgi:hypothetical protein